jgi:hypothetical protein
MHSSSRYPARGLTAPRLIALVLGTLLAGTVALSADAATCVTTGSCLLRFVNQPNTTQTGAIIKSGYDSTGDAIRVEIYNPTTGLVVSTNAQVTLTRSYYPGGGTLSGGGPVSAVNGVATFPSLSLNHSGAYRLQASSSAASNTPITNLFVIADVVEACSGVDCSFKQTQGKNSYKIDPATGTQGAAFVASLNLGGLKISCDFSPYSYPDSRQPNSVWYVYDDGTVGSVKTVTITIDKQIVQETAENGASFYRVCYTSPIRFTDRNGQPAPADPWTTPDGNGAVGPSTYFGTTWYTGLLPDCKAVSNVAPCVVSWSGSKGGNRLGVFITPPGDPGYR